VSRLLPAHAHTPLNKNFAPDFDVVVVTRRVVTYGIRAGSTCDLGFAAASVDLNGFLFYIYCC